MICIDIVIGIADAAPIDGLSKAIAVLI